MSRRFEGLAIRKGIVHEVFGGLSVKEGKHIRYCVAAYESTILGGHRFYGHRVPKQWEAMRRKTMAEVAIEGLCLMVNWGTELKSLV